MHDFVVRERQNEVLTERIPKRECQLIVLISAMNGILLKIAERVVHPTHVPLQAESEATHVDRPAHPGPSGRFLGDHEYSGVLAMDDCVQFLDEVDCLEVFAAP